MKLLAKIFPFLFKTQWLVKPEHEIALAFTHEGEDYYMFVNEQNMPAERAFSAMDIYEELDQRITRDYLEKMLDGMAAALNKGDLQKAFQLVHFAQQRVKHITNIEILYKLASVLYFTKEENCYKYDREYNEKKIEKWKKSDIDAFFLKTPISDFLPSFDGSSMNTRLYTLAQNEDLLRGMELLSSSLSGSESAKGTLTELRSQMDQLKQWNASLK